MIRALFIAAVVLCLTACGTPPSVQNVKTVVTQRCQAETPTRPAMPTSALPRDLPDDKLDQFVAAATAEIELREGYEQRLYAALQSCL